MEHHDVVQDISGLSAEDKNIITLHESFHVADKDKPDWRWENLRRHFHYHGGRKQLWQNLQESLGKDALLLAGLKPFSLDQNNSEDQITDELIRNIYRYCGEILTRLGCETLSSYYRRNFFEEFL